jgi:hypothetical protein
LQTQEKNPEAENPREDVVYDALRRINYGITFRMALNNPLGNLIVILFLGLSAVIYIVAMA